MNEILQQRIEEAAKRYSWSHDTIGVDKETFHTEASQKHPIPIDKEVRVPIQHEMEVAFKCAAHFILNNLWISVEEALPPYDDRLKAISIDVIVRNEYGKVTSAWYDYANKLWHLLYGEIAGDDVLDSKITHWMHIPQLKGGKK